MNSRILIIGGYGVFGGRLSAALLQGNEYDVIVAGRSLQKAEAFCERHGGIPYTIDIDAIDLTEQVRGLAPAIIVDAAGPWQDYGKDPYRVARAGLACGAHYLDLSDDAAFSEGIASLDTDARTKGVVIISGVSSVPALSSSATDALSKGMTSIELVESAITPGNRAPRGQSVIRSILSQTGQPLKVWKAGAWRHVTGWGAIRSITLTVPGIPPLKNRWLSPIGAPDLTLLPSRYDAASVQFSAGLELKLMHGGLFLLGKLVSRGLVKSLTSWTSVLQPLATLLRPFGSDRGGMRVSVTGKTAQDTHENRIWTLIAEAGDGPDIPTVPARIMIPKLLTGQIDPGARPCLGEFTLDEAEDALSSLNVSTGRTDTEITPVFRQVLGGAFDKLAAPLQHLHTVTSEHVWEGEAEIHRGKGFLALLANRLAGFPPSGRNVPVRVSMVRNRNGEMWTRQFGTHRFSSHLRRVEKDDSGIIRERFGILDFSIRLLADENQLEFPVMRARFLGVPLPRFLLPVSNTRETVLPDGSCQFDVAIYHSFAGLVAHYKGWLRPAA